MWNKIKTGLFIGLQSSLTGLMGALGGADNSSKALRRWFIPVLIFANAYNSTQNLWCILTLSMVGFLSLGYGIPSWNDEGSALGRGVYKLFPYPLTPDTSKCGINRVICEVLTRGVIALGIGVSLLPIAIIVNNLTIWVWILSGIILNSLIWGVFVHPKWTFKLFGRNLLLEEFLIHGINTLLALMLIYK